ncbi:MAG: hypothetical protein HZB12_00785 [Candidatus Yonathbacteria bacterium]|nr:hypothetical protein [Candidatus Yonathbacteria bacterium]
MVPLLLEKFAEEIKKKQLTLIHGDILHFQGHPLDSAPSKGIPWMGVDGTGYKLVANIPYYLTGQIIRMFLEAKIKPERMILMVQKEVATRIVARDKKESILSIAVKAYGAPRIIKKVPARYFTPAPNVDSAILAIENISNKNFADKESEKKFFAIVRTGFAHKRKVLAGNLKEIFGDQTLPILKEVGIPENARAENLSLEQWLAISKYQPYQ